MAKKVCGTYKFMGQHDNRDVCRKNPSKPFKTADDYDLTWISPFTGEYTWFPMSGVTLVDPISLNRGYSGPFKIEVTP